MFKSFILVFLTRFFKNPPGNGRLPRRPWQGGRYYRCPGAERSSATAGPPKSFFCLIQPRSQLARPIDDMMGRLVLLSSMVASHVCVCLFTPYLCYGCTSRQWKNIWNVKIIPVNAKVCSYSAPSGFGLFLQFWGPKIGSRNFGRGEYFATNPNFWPLIDWW